MRALETLLAGLARGPDDDTGWLALADCLSEQGEDDRAELVRVQLALRRHLDTPGWPVVGQTSRVARPGRQPGKTPRRSLSCRWRAVRVVAASAH